MINITVTSNAIIAESTIFLTMEDLLDALNTADGDVADAILEAMPEDYDYIMNEEDYGTLFGMGSPQVHECGWKFTYETDVRVSRLTVTGFR